MSEKKNILITLTPVLLLFLNLFLKLIHITTNSIGGDEPFTIYHAQMEVPTIIQLISQTNNPPLFEIILHFWTGIFGIGPLAVRIPSLLFSVATAWLVYRTGKDFFNYRIGLMAALFFTFSNYFMAFAHEARVYALFGFLASLSVYSFLHLLERRGKAAIHIVLLIIANTLMIYSHFFGFFVLSVQVLTTFLLIRSDRPLFIRLLLCQLFVFLFYIPWFPVIYERFTYSAEFGTWLGPPQGFFGIPDMLRTFNNEQFGETTLFGRHPWLTIFYSVIFLAAAVRFVYRKEYRALSKRHLYIFASFILPFTIMFAVSFAIPMFHDRYLVFAVLGYMLSLAVCIDYLFTDPAPRLILMAVCLTGMVLTFTPDVDNKRHAKEAVDKVKSLMDDQTVVLICPQYFAYNFAYYYDQPLFRDVDHPDAYGHMLASLTQQRIYSIYHIDQAVTGNAARVVYLDAAAGFTFPDNNIIPALEKEYRLNSISRFYEIFTVYEFLRQPGREGGDQ